MQCDVRLRYARLAYGMLGFDVLRYSVSRRPVRVPPRPCEALDFRSTDFVGSGYANFISDDVVLGRFPFVEPSRLRDPKAGRARLAEVLGAGVDVFVSLIDELPPQEQHLGNIDGFWGYYRPVQELASGEDPEHPVDPREVKFLHFPIVDMRTPPFEQLLDIVDTLEAEVAAGRKLYIHCWGGRGRAATVGACLIGRLEALSADDALERVQEAYSARGQDPF